MKTNSLTEAFLAQNNGKPLLLHSYEDKVLKEQIIWSYPKYPAPAFFGGSAQIKAIELENSRYLHFYLGAPAMILFDGNPVMGADQVITTAVLWDVISYPQTNPGSSVLIIPKLKRFTALSEEDWDACQAISESCSPSKQGITKTKNETAQMVATTWKCFEPKVLQYLLSKGYDMFDLIDSGHALDVNIKYALH